MYYKINVIQKSYNHWLGRRNSAQFEPWACLDCDCTERLEARMKDWGGPFIAELQNEVTEVEATEKEQR